MGFLKPPKPPKPTQQENAAVARQARLLDEETAKNEKRLKATARGRLGSASLLANANPVGSNSRSGRNSNGTMMGGGNSGSASGQNPYGNLLKGIGR